MGELAREHRSRSIHVSRGHLAAAAVAVVLWTISSVAAGYLWGRSAAPVAATVPGPTPTELPDTELADALSRIEASAAPDALGEISAGYPADPQLAPPGAAVIHDVDPLTADPIPRGAFTISLGQFDVQEGRAMRIRLAGQGVEAWRAPVVTGDQVTVRLAVGGFESEAAAGSELLRIGSVLQSLGIDSADVVGMP